MMKKNARKLELKREKLKTLTTELDRAAGGRPMDADPTSSYQTGGGFSGFP